MMIFTYDYKDGAYVELEGRQVRFWRNEGLPDYRGDIDGFAEQFPDHVAELVKKGFLRESK